MARDEVERAPAAAGRRVRRRRLLLVGVAALLAFAALGALVVWWTEFRFPAREERVAGVPVELRVQAGVPAAELQAVRDGLRLGARRLAALGAPLRGPVEARVARGDGCEAFLPAGKGATGIAKRGFLCVDTLAGGWRTLMREKRLAAPTVAAHELVHTVQAERGCLPGPDEHTHLWLVEGTAVHLSWQSLVAAGRATDADAERNARSLLRPGLGALSTYERRGGGDPEYALWHLAVRRLVAGRGDEALIAFCDRVAAGRPWRQAFAASFGVTPQRFSARFAPPR